MYIQNWLDFIIVHKGLWTWRRLLCCGSRMRANTVSDPEDRGFHPHSVSAGFCFSLSVK